MYTIFFSKCCTVGCFIYKILFFSIEPKIFQKKWNTKIHKDFIFVYLLINEIVYSFLCCKAKKQNFFIGSKKTSKACFQRFSKPFANKNEVFITKQGVLKHILNLLLWQFCLNKNYIIKIKIKLLTKFHY